MANNNNPHGLLPLMTNLQGGAPAIQRFAKLVGYATAIFQGDPVNRVSGGALQASITPGTTLITGVSLEYSPASTANAGIAVITDPGCIFESQAAGTLNATDMGLNANLYVGAGSTLTRQSGYAIDDTTKATTSTLDLHLLEAYTSVDNAYGLYARVEVIFNKSRMNGGTAGV